MNHDNIIIRSNFITMDPDLPRAEAVAIDPATGRISAVGSLDEVRERAGLGASDLDLRDRFIVPGFNDCHMHILPYGLDLAQADLSPSAGISDVGGLARALQEWRGENPGGDWVLGGRYDQNTFPGARHPTRQELDAAFPDRPVFITQTSKHAGVANSTALRLAGVTADTADPDGGEIVRAAGGEPTGLLMESAMDLVARLIPRPDRAGMAAAITRAHGALVREGITSASDLNTGWLNLGEEIQAYRQAAEAGAPVRTTLFPHLPVFGSPAEVPARRAFLQEWSRGDEAGCMERGCVRLGPAKLFSDGALTVRTAALREPYIDGSGMGMLLHPPAELNAYVQAAHSGGWQVAVHAIGDRAIELVLDCFLGAQQSHPRAGCRHRIEHAMLLDKALIRRFVEQDVLPVVQPEFLSRLGDAYVLGLGPERAARLNPVASLQRAGLGVPFSSDCPIVPGAPLDGIRAAARRITRNGNLLGPDERICPEEGLRGYTYWAAYSTFDEAETGTITVGKRADLTVLSADPTCNIDSARVTATVISGRCVFGSIG